MEVNKLVLASHNKNKILEFQAILGDKVDLLSAGDFSLKDPIEDGLTFEDNALIKAKYVSESVKLPALSDDSGFEIVALNNEPGIYSARWAEKYGSYDKVFQVIQEKMLTSANKSIEARFVCVLCLYFLDGSYHFFKGISEGIISFPSRGENGFAYDKIFIPEDMLASNKTFAEMNPLEKNKISHRGKAIVQLKSFFNIK